MQLISELCSGFADAPGGFARIYRRGTTTAATVYSDFKGQVPVTTHTLDSRGRVNRYVNEIVDVAVYDANGTAVVETFTPAQQATALEIIHAHFTGTDYDTAASGLNKPLTAQTLLDKVYTSFGADDFNALFAGSATTIQSALAQLTLGGIYSVRSSTYGAAGDGVADDTSEIQAAIAAAAAAGGGIVYLAAGRYRISSHLDFNITNGAKVSLIGAGPANTTLEMDHASNDWIRVGLAAPSTGRQLFSGIAFASQQTCSGSNINDTGAAWSRVTVQDCWFSASVGGPLVKVDAVRDVIFDRCIFNLASTNASSNAFHATNTTSTGPAWFRDCVFLGPSGAWSPTNAVVYANAVKLQGCFFSFAGTAGTGTMINTRAKGYSSVWDCRFVPGSSTWVCMNPGAFTGGAGDDGGAMSIFIEGGNIFQDLNVGLSYAPFTGWGNSGGHYFLHSRMARHREQTATGTQTVNLDMRAAGSAIVNCTGSGSTVTFSVTDTASGDAPMGSLFHLVVKNSSGGAVTVAFSSAVVVFKRVVVSPSNGNRVGYTFMRTAADEWSQVGASVDAA